MKLRPYQKQAIQQTDDNTIIAMPTGTGKSLVIGGLTKLTLSRPKSRVLVLAHVKELLFQNHKQTLAFDDTLDAGIYSAGLRRRDTENEVIFAGIASVYKRAVTLGFFNLVLIDECHLVSDDDTTMYQRLLADLKEINPELKVVGLTATPWRTTSGLLTDGELFDSVCYDLTGVHEYNQLVADGYLSPLVARAMDAEFDTSGVKIRGGEFVSSALQEKVDNKELTRLAVAEMVRRSEGRKHWLVFATGIEHCEHVSKELNANGIRASFVHSKLTTAERDSRLAAFKAGELTALVNNNILTTGFDFPGIDLIGMLRPTMSPGLWVQMLGRGTRTAPGKDDCLVLDFAGNTMRLGPINNVQIPHSGERGKGRDRRSDRFPARHPVRCAGDADSLRYRDLGSALRHRGPVPDRGPSPGEPADAQRARRQRDRHRVPLTNPRYRGDHAHRGHPRCGHRLGRVRNGRHGHARCCRDRCRRQSGRRCLDQEGISSGGRCGLR